MTDHFKTFIVAIWMLGAATAFAAFAHGQQCFGVIGGVWFAFFALAIQSITYKVVTSPEIKQGFVKGFAIVVNIVLFIFLASFGTGRRPAYPPPDFDAPRIRKEIDWIEFHDQYDSSGPQTEEITEYD